jgi:transketolase C-terminal domain/subunit
MAFVAMRNQYAESGQPQELLEKYHLMPDDIVKAVGQIVEFDGAR